MRKNTSEMLAAFVAGVEFQQSARDIVLTNEDGITLWRLHNNKIAEKCQKGDRAEIVLTLAGWNTPTTRDRLNAILAHYGFGSVSTKEGQPFYRSWNGKKFWIMPTTKLELLITKDLKSFSYGDGAELKKGESVSIKF